MRAIELYEREIATIVDRAGKFKDLQDIEVLALARDLHRVDKDMVGLVGREWRRFKDLLSSIKMDLVGEMRERRIPISKLFTN